MKEGRNESYPTGYKFCLIGVGELESVVCLELSHKEECRQCHKYSELRNDWGPEQHQCLGMRNVGS
jgi:hypothetical protein